ncbi:hypothetical protein MJD09_01035 [bacterium]|nr:hypothetical protein [bacterium]
MSTTLRHGRTGGRVFYTLIFFYLLIGFIFVPIIFVSEDFFLATTLLATYTMFMIGGLILVEYHTVVVSPDDFGALAYLPISSRTYFVTKLTNLLFYVMSFTLILALPTVITFLFFKGLKPLLAFSAFLAVFSANFTTTMAIVLLYTFLMTRVSLQRLQNLLAFFQIGLAFLVYSSFFIVPKLMERTADRMHLLSDSMWFLFLPSAWFSKLVPIALGEANRLDWLFTLISFAGMGLVCYLAFSRLSFDYSKRLAEIAESASSTKRKTSFWKLRLGFPFLSSSPEARVIAKLVKKQFVFDNKFKMAVLGILPLMIFYLFLGVEKGPLPDPFINSDFDKGRTGLLYLLVFLFPMMLRTYVTQSDAYRASWIFYSTPTDIRKLILAEKKLLMAYFVLPFLVVLGMIFFYYFQNPIHVLLHLCVLGMLAHLFLQLGFLYSPDLPFSRPNVKGRRSKHFALFLVLIPFLIYLLLPLIYKFVYPSILRYLSFCAAVLATSWILEGLLNARISSLLRKLEFTV